MSQILAIVLLMLTIPFVFGQTQETSNTLMTKLNSSSGDTKILWKNNTDNNWALYERLRPFVEKLNQGELDFEEVTKIIRGEDAEMTDGEDNTMNNTRSVEVEPESHFEKAWTKFVPRNDLEAILYAKWKEMPSGNNN